MNRTRMILGFLLAAVFLYLFLRNIDLYDLWSTIRKGNPYWLLLSGSLALFNYFFRALRWRLFFQPIKKTRISNLFKTTVIGFSVSTIFPAKIGELVRPYLLGKKENISKSAALATVVVERVFDTATILFLLMIFLVFLVQPDQLSAKAKSSLVELNRAGVILFGGIVALVVFLYYLKTKPVTVKKLITKIERILPARISHSIDDILDSFIEGLSILHDPKILVTIAYFSIVFWVIICAGFWAGVRAYVPGFAFTNTFLIMTLLALGIAVPTPGGVGSYHLACKLGLALFFNVPERQASAVALVSHALVFIPMTILGLILLWKEGLSTGNIQQMAETEEATSR
jgi:glycosyltransferase 2 family protein